MRNFSLYCEPTEILLPTQGNSSILPDPRGEMQRFLGNCTLALDRFYCLNWYALISFVLMLVQKSWGINKKPLNRIGNCWRFNIFFHRIWTGTADNLEQILFRSSEGQILPNEVFFTSFFSNCPCLLFISSPPPVLLTYNWHKTLFSFFLKLSIAVPQEITIPHLV